MARAEWAQERRRGGGGQQSSHPEDHKGRGEGLAFTLRETGL